MITIVGEKKRRPDYRKGGSPVFMHAGSNIKRFRRQLDWDLTKTDNTRVVAMVGLKTQHPVFPAPLLAGTVLRYTLESSSGYRTLGLVIDPQFKLLLEKLGWTAYPFPLISKSELLLYSLDLRFEHVPRWAARMTGATVDDPMSALKSVTETGMRRLLSAYHDAHRFQQHAHEEHLSLPVEQLRGILSQALRAFAQNPERAHAAHLLRQCYLEPHGETRTALADKLNVSRATFHRYLSRAVLEFTQFIQERV